jgi:hypothetical protein
MVSAGMVFLGGAAQGLTSRPLLVFCENLFLRAHHIRIRGIQF